MQKRFLRKIISVFGTCLLAAIMMVSVTVGPAHAKSKKPIVLKLSGYLPEGTNESQVAKWWGDQIEKKSNGAVKMEYYFAQALVKTMDSLPAVSSGIADIQFVAEGYYPSQLPLIGGLHLLYQSDSGYLMDKACTEMHASYAPFQKMMKDNNIKYLMSMSAGEVAMASIEPIEKLEDLKGKKVRAMGLMNDAMKLLGATPVAMPLPEVYEALERGTLDAVTGIPYHLIGTFKFHEVAKNVVGVRMGCYASGSYYMNLDVWKALPENIKQIITETNAGIPDRYADMTNRLYKKNTSQLRDARCVFFTLPDEEVAKCKTILVPKIYDDWVKKMEKRKLPGQETLDVYRQLVKKYQPEDKYQSPFVKP